jgi:hypothetical protein
MSNNGSTGAGSDHGKFLSVAEQHGLVERKLYSGMAETLARADP